MKDNNTQISIAKGIGIILMVIGHCILSGYANQFIYAFHMPLFFYLSGYCLKDKFFNDTLTFIKRKIKSLFIPYIKFNILFILFHNAFVLLYLTINDYNIITIVRKIITSLLLMEGTEQLLGGFWFLKQLLLASVIGLFILKYIKRKIIQTIFLIIFIYIFDLYKLNITYINFGSQTLLAILYFILGYHNKNLNLRRSFFTIIICPIIVAVIAFYSPTGIHGTTIYNFIPFIISSLCGIYMIFGLSDIISKHCGIAKTIEYIGNRTLSILVWHFLSFKLISLIAILYYKLPIGKLSSFPIIKELPNENLWIISYCLAGIILPILVDNIYNLTAKKINNYATKSKCNCTSI